MAPSRVVDDFILTISDSEADVPNYDEDEEGSADEAAEAAAPSSSSKRKRDLKKKSRVKKRRKLRDGGGASDDSSEDLDPSAAAVLAEDAAIDPSFEFDIGQDDGVVEGFEGWGETPGQKKNGTKALGVDEIIARRRMAEAVAMDDQKGRKERDTDQEDDRESDAAPVDLEEEEALADDAFGMGVDAEVSDEHDDQSDEEDEDNDEEQDADGKAHTNGTAEHDDDDAASDASSLEHVPHPDDLSQPSDNEADEEEEPSAAELAKRNAFFAPDDTAAPNSNGTATTEKTSGSSTSSFQTMSLSRPILRGLTALGFSTPTPIQAKTVPIALLGKDVVGGAVTGSGKTGAFMIPILERLLYRPRRVPQTRVGILMPTRELAVQCYNVATKLASFTDITFALVVGGLSLREQEQTLKKRPDVVIATPGRFIDHMRNTASFAVEGLEILVLDEADRMLEDGFADELGEILRTIPKSRQTMLFSATMTEDVDTLIRAGLNRPVRLMVDAKRATVRGLVQEFVKLKPGPTPRESTLSRTGGGGGGAEADDIELQRLACLLSLCQKTYTARVIVFFPTKSQAHRGKVLFALRNIAAAELHGGMSQEQRLAAIAAFREGTATHLLATDLASRGLDIPRVETVINFTVPAQRETYVHRVGRTARAGRGGVACTIFASIKDKKAAKSGGGGPEEGDDGKGPGSKKKKKKNKGGGAGGASERTLLRPILKLAKAQGAAIRTRTLPPAAVAAAAAQVAAAGPEIDEVLREEREERLVAQTEREVARTENLVRHGEEIAARPRRTWFQSERDKGAAKELGRAERQGAGVGPLAAEGAGGEGERKKTTKGEPRKKLSGKEKKRLADRDERKSQQESGRGGGLGWKKGRADRIGGGAAGRARGRGNLKGPRGKKAKSKD